MEIKEEIELVSNLKKISNNNSARLMNLYISGSHLYGWNSKDSDIDIRGCFILHKSQFLGLNDPIRVLSINSEDDTDIVLFEVKKFIKLALCGNCNILEELNANQIYKTSEFINLRQLINNAFGKNGIYHSYKGLAEFNYKKFILQGKNTVKKYLYVIRSLMAGIYVLQTGIIKPNIGELNKYFKIPEVNKLLEIKRNGLENEPLKDLEEGKLDSIIKELFERLDQAYIKSRIPERPEQEDIDKIERFLIDLRK